MKAYFFIWFDMRFMCRHSWIYDGFINKTYILEEQIIVLILPRLKLISTSPNTIWVKLMLGSPKENFRFLQHWNRFVSIYVVLFPCQFVFTILKTESIWISSLFLARIMIFYRPFQLQWLSQLTLDGSLNYHKPPSAFQITFLFNILKAMFGLEDSRKEKKLLRKITFLYLVLL